MKKKIILFCSIFAIAFTVYINNELIAAACLLGGPGHRECATPVVVVTPEGNIIEIRCSANCLENEYACCNHDSCECIQVSSGGPS